MPDRRFPRRIYRQGSEPDPRFSLANERTFLAWVRTALALYAGAFALEALDLPSAVGWRGAASVVFLVIGTLAAVQALFGWARTELSMRLGKPLPGPAIGGVVVVGVVLAVAFVVIGLFA